MTEISLSGASAGTTNLSNTSTGTGNFSFSPATSTLFWDGATTISNEYITLGGTGYSINYQNKNMGLNPGLYFRFMKSKLTKLQAENLKKRLKKLQALITDAEDLKQDGYAEELAKMMAIVVREQEAFVCGITMAIEKNIVTKFMAQVKDSVVKFDKLESFPRPIPKAKKTKILACQKRGLFDEYHILYTDYVNEKIKSTKEKIIEKDPICFGTYKYQPDKLYFICDWIDEFCDLTLDKIVDKAEVIIETPDLDKRYIQKLKTDVSRRHDVLKATNAKNYLQLAELESRRGRGFWRKLFDLLQGKD